MIFLTILKILGIVILSILGIILTLILLILFVPIRYSSKGSFSKQDMAVSVSFKVTWLLHLLKFVADYEKESGLEYSLKILGIKVFPRRNMSCEIEQNYNEEYDHDEEFTNADLQKNNVEEYKKEDDIKEEYIKEEYIKDTNEEKDIFEFEDDNSIENEDEIFIYDETKTNNKIRQFIDFLNNIFKKAKTGIINISYTLRSLCDKIRHVIEKFEYYKAWWESRTTQAVLSRIIRHLGYFLGKLKPKKFCISIDYGNADPAETGQLYGKYMALSAWIGKWIVFNPEFDNEVLDAEYMFKGYLQLYVVLIIAWQLYFDKELRRVKKRFDAAP